MGLRRRIADWLAPPLTAPPPAAPRLLAGVTASAVAEVTGQGTVDPADIWSIPRPMAGVLPKDMAFDTCIPTNVTANAMAWAMQSRWHEGLAFLGYPYLAELSQRPEYRHISETIASNMTRKWIALKGPDEKRISELEAHMLLHRVRDKFRKVAELDGFFGRAQIHIDIGSRTLSSRLVVGPATVGKGKLRALTVIEPFWTYPGIYNATDPFSDNFYKPTVWYCMGQTIDASRLLTFVGREVPDMLKPVYTFGGLSMSQMAKPYVDNWLRTRQSVSDLLHSFSTMVLATDMSTVLSGGGAQQILNRLDFFNRTRDNRGSMAIDKDREELTNVSTPLGTLDALQAQAQEQMASVSGIPLVELLGVTPSGLNASSDGEVRTFYARIKSHQERFFGPHLQTVMEILQLDLWGEIDPEITYEFLDLWETSETDKAAIRKSDAEADVWYVNAGIVSADETRERLSNDESGLYFGIDLSAPAPEAPDDADLLGDGEGLPDLAGDEFNESDHPRDKDGKFSDAHEAASAMAQYFNDLGKKTSPIDHSINRYGQKSSYFSVEGINSRIRVSDHPHNEHFALGDITVPHTSVSREYTEKFLRDIEESQKKNESKREAEKQAVKEYEKPFIQEYKSNPSADLEAAITKAYPSSVGNKAWRREIRGRFLAET